MERHKKGGLTEAIVISELKRRNISVSTPFGDNEPYDLLVQTPNGALLRVQVKTGRFIDGTVRFKAVSQHTNARGNTIERYGSDVDYFIVYCDELEAMYLITEDEVHTAMHLRIDPPESDHPSINWAEEYEFDRCWPPDDTATTEFESEIPPHRRGDATEAWVIAELLRRDIPIAIPPTDNERYDLVARTPIGDFLRIQIKTGRIERGSITFNARTTHANAQGNVSKPYHGDVDYFLVGSPSYEDMYLVAEDAFNASISLRVEEPKQVHRDTKWAAEYEFDRNWPPSTATLPPSIRQPPRYTMVHDAVIDALRDHDISVVRPVDDTTSYDLLAETPAGDFVRLAIRTAQLKDGRIFFHPDDEDEDDNEDSTIDQYLLYCYDLDETYLIPTDAFDSSISLWVAEPTNVWRTTTWVEDFELARRWPVLSA